MALFSVRKLSEQEKDLEILILRQQLNILQRKHNKPIRPNRVEKIPLSILAVRLNDGFVLPEKNAWTISWSSTIPTCVKSFWNTPITTIQHALTRVSTSSPLFHADSPQPRAQCAIEKCSAVSSMTTTEHLLKLLSD